MAELKRAFSPWAQVCERSVFVGASRPLAAWCETEAPASTQGRESGRGGCGHPVRNGARAFSSSLCTGVARLFPEQSTGRSLLSPSPSAPRSLAPTGTRGLGSFLQKSPRPWFKFTSCLIWPPGPSPPGRASPSSFSWTRHVPKKGLSSGTYPSPQETFWFGSPPAPRHVEVTEGRQLRAPDSPHEATYVGKRKSFCSKRIHKLYASGLSA